MKITIEKSKKPSKRDESLYQRIESEVVPKWGEREEKLENAHVYLADLTRVDSAAIYNLGKLENLDKKVICFYRKLIDNEPREYIPENSKHTILEFQNQSDLVKQINSELRNYTLNEIKKAVRLYKFL